jgi:L-amino acid N-acyltransferase YncA
MNIRRATAADFPGMLPLQEANLIDNLTSEQRRAGYLSARFSEEQFARMNRDAAIAVAEDGGRVVGYACSAEVEYSRQFPILAAMIATFDRVTFLGNVLADARVAIYGPVCVDSAFRGRGVFRELINKLKEELAGRFEVAVAFVAKGNSHSVAAHVDGLGMTVLGDYVFEAGRYWIVAFGIPPTEVVCSGGPRQRL